MQRLVHEIEAALVRIQGPPTWIHGDFYAKQVLVGPQGVRFIDFDEARRGLALEDLGNFLAHLEHRAIRGDISRELLSHCGEQLLAGYRSPLDLRQLQALTAASLFVLAPHAFRRGQSDWPSSTEHVLDRVEQLLELSRSRQKRPSKLRRVEARASRKPKVDVPQALRRDSAFEFLTPAFDPAQAAAALQGLLSERLGTACSLAVESIQVRRHKPGRRCLIEYRMLADSSKGKQTLTAVGKVRAKGLDHRALETQFALWKNGFDLTSGDGVCVPQPLGAIGPWNMCLQYKVPGYVVTQRLVRSPDPSFAQRLAAAVYKLHQTSIHVKRRHRIEDELQVLRDRLSHVGQQVVHWKKRLSELYAACQDMALAKCDNANSQLIHRDFYPDQIVCDGEQLWIVDLDLCSYGDPALDVGNFSGHLLELGLRTHGQVDTYRKQTMAFERRYVDLAGSTLIPRIQAYRLLTLARHISISTQFPDRRHATGAILSTCERLVRQDGELGEARQS